MTPAKILVVFFISVLTISCNDQSIIGTWRRTGIKKYYPPSASNQNSVGDLVISPDSTFLMKGIDTHDTSNVPGWHSGGTMNGTWLQPDKNHIVLLPNDVDKRFASAFTFKIIILNNKNLVIASAFDQDGMTLKFTRQ
jgi:hypothetical protein